MQACIHRTSARACMVALVVCLLVYYVVFLNVEMHAGAGRRGGRAVAFTLFILTVPS
jgi:hypothetical protein